MINGTSHALASCLLRQQMLPSVVLAVGSITILIPNGCRGSLTGSRVAGAMGRVPVEATICDRHQGWNRHGFRTAAQRLTVATYVDNIYRVGSSLHGAIAILEDFEAQLQRHWGLKIKEISRSCLVPRGCAEMPYNCSK